MRYQLEVGVIMRKKITLIIKSVIFMLLFAALLLSVTLVVQRKSSYIKNEMFMRQAKKDNIDIFLLGSSHVINGVNPLQMYEEQGITAYNLGGYGSVLLSSYWQMMLALDYCTPKLVVVDAYMLENDIRFIDDPGANVDSDELHLNIDRFLLNRTKVSAIRDMFGTREKKYPFLWDFIVYHDRWKELDSNDFKRLGGNAEINRIMGADILYNVHSAEYNYVDYGSGSLPGETVGTTYLRRIIDECQSRGIDVMVVTLPYLAMGEGQAAAHKASEIANEYGIPEINMLEVANLVDYNSDFEDPGHMNVLGSVKVTSFLGSKIREFYDLPDHRGDSKYSDWQECAAKYYSDQEMLSRENEDLYSQCLFLELGKNSNCYAISIMGGSACYGDKAFIRQLHSLGAGPELDKAISSASPYLLVSDMGQVTEIAGYSADSPYEISTSMAGLSYLPASDIFRVLNVNGDADNNFLYSDDHPYADVQLLFLEDGSVESHQFYTCDHFTYDYFQN